MMINEICIIFKSHIISIILLSVVLVGAFPGPHCIRYFARGRTVCVALVALQQTILVCQSGLDGRQRHDMSIPREERGEGGVFRVQCEVLAAIV